MTIKEVTKRLNLKIKSGNRALNNKITGGYASDLLSDVIANSRKGNIWVTLQIHKNIIAIAVLKELSGIIIVNNREPDSDTIKKAKEENIPVLITSMPAFEVIGKLFELGIAGMKK